MKKISGYLLFTLFLAADIFYLALTADSFRQEYVQDNFVHWGFPQWGWMYADADVYFRFNVVYLFLLVAFPVAGCLLWLKRHYKTALTALFLPLVSAAVFWYMPTYNWNRQFALFNAERGTENSRVPEGKWWVSGEQMERYYDASWWERAKGYFGRGEWPGGYAVWGDYRIWLLPDFRTDTLGRRGLAFHGGEKNASPWGIDLGDEIIDFAIQLRRAKVPLEINIQYDNVRPAAGAASAETPLAAADGDEEANVDERAGENKE